MASVMQFTQSNFQDYLTCKRRFELRYLRQLNWPAIESAPIQEAERRMQLGSDFHRLLHQHLLGLPKAELTLAAEQIATLTQSPELAEMWQNYCLYPPTALNESDRAVYPELTLSTMLAGHRLTAKFDLVVKLPDTPTRFLIIDWKTNQIDANKLRQRMQSRVYPYVLVCAGASLHDEQPLDPAEVTMCYWFASQPDRPLYLSYSQTQFEQDQRDLSALIEEITTVAEFPLTEESRACQYCVYRSYCDRGKMAGPLDEMEEDLELEELLLDLEQIAEIAY